MGRKAYRGIQIEVLLIQNMAYVLPQKYFLKKPHPLITSVATFSAMSYKYDELLFFFFLYFIFNIYCY